MFLPPSPIVFFAYLGLKIGYTKRSKPNKHIEKKSTMKPVANVFSCFSCLGIIILYTDKMGQNMTKPSHPKNSLQLTSLRYEWVAAEIQRITVAPFCGPNIAQSYSDSSGPIFVYTQTFDGFFGLKTMKNCFSSWLVVVWNMTFHSVDPNSRVNHIFFRGGPGLKPPSRWLFTIINHIITININH